MNLTPSSTGLSRGQAGVISAVLFFVIWLAVLYAGADHPLPPRFIVTAAMGDTSLCGRPIDTLGKLEDGFWSDIAKKSTGAKRSALDQARMQLFQQLLAAELNASAFGAALSGGVAAIKSWEAAYCGTNQTAIKNAQQAAASFNSSGDSSAFTPGASADPNSAKRIENRAWWDTLP